MEEEQNCAYVNEMMSHLKPPVPIVDHDDNSLIGQFYANKSLFITGATGFIGKALVEKLIRSCSGIKKIYLLIREKRGKDINERLQDLISAQCFDRIRELNNGSNKTLMEKLHPIRGDITLPKFGISANDMKLLSAECRIVFNSAATIRFVEPIDMAVRNNIFSVGQLVEFCNGLDHLEALIHLSTAYSNCHKKDTIYEIFYEPPMRGAEILDTIQKLQSIQDKIHVYPDSRPEGCSVSRDACEQQTFYFDNYTSDDLISFDSPKSLMGEQKKVDRSNGDQRPYDLLSEFTEIALRRSNRPNTYTFTKAISETYLLDQVKARPDHYLNGKIPVAIIRPSIVGGAWREPMVGLVDNYNGPTGAMLSLYTGALQAMPGDGSRVADVVPVDMVASMVLATGWFLVEQSSDNDLDKRDDNDSIKPDHGVYLFNFVSGYQNPYHWQTTTDKILETAQRYPSKFLTRLPGSYFIPGGKKYELYDKVNQKFPAFMSDFVRKNLLGQSVEGRNSALMGYSRIKQMTDTLTPFTSNQWKLCDTNTQKLFKKLTQVDKNMFNFDVNSISWNDYTVSYIIGARVYLLKDGPESLPKAMRNFKRRELVNSSLIAVLMFIFFYIILQFVFRPQAGQNDL